MNPRVLRPTNLDKLVLLRYAKTSPGPEVRALFESSGVIDGCGKLTPFGYDLAYAAHEYLQVLETDEPEAFRAVDVKGQSVLDAGCCGGAYVFRALEFGARNAVGVDLNANYIAVANALKTKLGHTHAQFVLDDCETMTKVEGDFDVVISRLVSPLLDLEAFIRGLSAKTQPGSVLYLKTHSFGFYRADAARNLRSGDLARLGRAFFAVGNGVLENTIHRRITLRWQGNPHRDVFYTHRNVRRTLEQNGWRVRSDNWQENRRTPYVVAERA